VSLKKLGRYDLVRVLGKGAMGIVYEGRDPNLDRRVAIKTVKVENLSEEAAAEYEARFRTEARSAARLQHPNIVSVYDSDRHGDIAFLVMEFIQGDDLKYHLDKGIRYSLEQSLKMIRDLLSALDYAHKQGIVHRDIKPANLLIEPGGRVKLTDFGVARIQDSGEATRTQGSMVGTLKYMSPEQVQGQKIDSRADLFSVGVVLYQLLTDKRPFDGDNDFSIIHQIIGHTPAPPSLYNARLPSAIDAVVARALAKDREQRFASARDFATALQSAIRRAEDATVVPPADPFKKSDPAGTGSRGQQSAGAVGGSTVTQELELVYWKDIKDSTDPEELEGFLAKFPAGIYADLARRRLRKLAGGSSPDQTMLSGTFMPGREQDLEATRLRSGTTTPLVVAAGPVPAAPAVAPPAVRATPHQPAEFSDSVFEPAEATSPSTGASEAYDPTVPAHQAAVPAPAVAAAAASADSAGPPAPIAPAMKLPPEPTASRTARPATPVRKKPALAVLAGLAAVAVAGIAAALLMGKGPGDNPAAAQSISASTPAPEVPIAAPVVLAAAPIAAAAASGASPASPAASKASAARRAAIAPRARTASSGAAVEPVPTLPAAVARREEPRSATGPIGAGPNPVDGCRDKIFLSREFCLAEHCPKPALRGHPLCAQWRDEVKLREESRHRN
jgi:serine/threonine-protein kinase